MIGFSEVKEVTIPEGKATRITSDGKIIFAYSQYKILYSGNGASNSTIMSSTTVEGHGVTLNAVVKSNEFTRTGYNFTGWNTKEDGSGVSYTEGQTISLGSNITLYAQWQIKTLTVTYRHTESSWAHGESDTGPMENYALYIDGVEQSDLGAFSNSARTFTKPYGTKIKVWVKAKYGYSDSYVNLNGSLAPGTSVGETAEYTFWLKSNVDIHFEWVTSGIENINAHSFWCCHITTS